MRSATLVISAASDGLARRMKGTDRPACTRRRSVVPLVALLICVVGLAACGTPTQSGTTTIPSVALTAKDYAFDAPQGLPGGLVALTLDNQGQEPHQAQIARLHDGVTREQVADALKQGPEAALPLVSLVGGPNAIDPGMKQTVIVDLPPGEYLALCFLASPDGHSHIEKGMTASFTVAAADARPSEPTAAGLVTLKDFAFDLPERTDAGSFTWKVWNNGSQPHELTLVKVAQEKTPQEVMEYLHQPSGAPPFSSVGGMVALDPGKSGWVQLDLDPGTYMAFCFVPEPATHMAHFELGMSKTFEVH